MTFGVRGLAECPKDGEGESDLARSAVQTMTFDPGRTDLP